MSTYKANCPSCGADLQFHPGALVAICEYCRSVVAKTEQSIELIGKVSIPFENDSDLHVGILGSFQSTPFTVVGHIQLQHAAGGMWDEWYLYFDDGRWGWLAEAQGKLFLTFASKNTYHNDYDWEDLAREPVGSEIHFGVDGHWIIQEIGTALISSAEGELPFTISIEEIIHYIDVAGSKGKFATIDFSYDPPAIFAGREVSLNDLHLFSTNYKEKKELKTDNLSCQSCAAPISLYSPSRAQRVTCQSCGALHDISQGSLKYLTAIEKQESLEIPPGTEGILFGQKYICIGWVSRYCLSEGLKYFWEEFLLYNKEIGFRWLVYSDFHWNFVEEISAADIDNHEFSSIFYDKETYNLYQSVPAYVDSVMGEFYWKVEIGENCWLNEYICPPKSLSKETSIYENNDGVKHASEIHWSLARYIEPEEVYKAFSLKKRPRKPTIRSSNEPNPYIENLKNTTKLFVVFASIAVAMFILAMIRSSNEVIYSHTYTAPYQTEGVNNEVIITIDDIDLSKSNQPIEITLQTPNMPDNTWFGVEGNLINKSDAKTLSFFADNYYYSGEGWAEAQRIKTIYSTSNSSGNYSLSVKLESDPINKYPDSFNLEIKYTRPYFSYMFLAMIFLGIIPLFYLIMKSSFESKRWQNSSINNG